MYAKVDFELVDGMFEGKSIAEVAEILGIEIEAWDSIDMFGDGEIIDWECWEPCYRIEFNGEKCDFSQWVEDDEQFPTQKNKKKGLTKSQPYAIIKSR